MDDIRKPQETRAETPALAFGFRIEPDDAEEDRIGPGNLDIEFEAEADGDAE